MLPGHKDSVVKLNPSPPWKGCTQVRLRDCVRRQDKGFTVYISEKPRKIMN